ncbi:MAG: DUF2971 domain-containing protein [Caldilineaceae bacterium]|nr:DUF2971 domain-containing protein [Caldilineaceae bacterium]
MNENNRFELPEVEDAVIDLETGEKLDLDEFIRRISPEKRDVARKALEEHLQQKKDMAQELSRRMKSTLELPSVIYKYVPLQLFKCGWRPTTLRASQLSALNDVMECNVETRKYEEEDESKWRTSLIDSLKENLGYSLTPEELDARRRLFGDPRVSTIIQQYLNPLVGVVALSTDPLIPTMWAHYAQNTGFVIGYKTDVLRTLGFEMRRMLYLDCAPMYSPTIDNTIRVHFVDKSRQERERREGVHLPGVPRTPFVGFVKLDGTPREISRLLFVKGETWEYEQEARLLVNSRQTRLLEHRDNNGFPIRVIDIPNEAIQEVYVGFNTPRQQIQEMVNVINVDGHQWDLKYTTSHAYRMRPSVMLRYNPEDPPATFARLFVYPQSGSRLEHLYSEHFESKSILDSEQDA